MWTANYRDEWWFDMTSLIYTFDFGDWRCAVIHDGAFAASADYLFASAPAAERDAVLSGRGLDPERIIVPVNVLLVDMDDTIMLIDTGMGTAAGGQLREDVEVAGIDPEAVGIVVLTHVHADHIGGLWEAPGRLMYPNARHIINTIEWEYWTDEINLRRHGTEQERTVREYLLPLSYHVELVLPPTEVVPGVRLLSALGHTIGHIVVELTSGGERLLCSVDTAVLPLHMEYPGWVVGADQLPDRVEVTRRRIFGQAAVDGTFIFANHAPFPGLGRVQADGTRFLWQPET